jgi:hypothetical protein
METTTRRPASAELDAFIIGAKSHGIEDGALVSLLRQSGWSERRVYRSLAQWYASALGLPPPMRSDRGESARDAFLYLLNFITLAFWTTALGNLCYVLIARTFPDRAWGAIADQPLIFSISWQLAAIIMTLPVFLAIHRIIQRELARRPDLFESAVRLWLSYIALVIAAMIILVDGIWFVQALLQGELTVRFALDSAVLLILGGGVFASYFIGLRARAGEA